jgi:hypothetical protein
MDRVMPTRYLLMALLVVCLGLLVVNAGYVDRGLPELVQAPAGPIRLADAFLTAWPIGLFAPGLSIPLYG